MFKSAVKHYVRKDIFGKSRIEIIFTFFAGQGLLQLVNVLTGVLLLRWMSVDEYAQYSITFAFQSTAQTLVELGFSGAIIALVGNRIHDKKTIGAYIKAGQYYRNRSLLIIGSFCVVLFPWITSHHHWSVYSTILLLISILFNLYFSGYIAYYSAPLKMHKQLKDLYLIQIKSGVYRLIILGITSMVISVNAWFASFVSSISILFNGFMFRKKSEPFIEEPKIDTSSTRKEVLKYVRPVMPGIIYSAFSSQIALFIISFFGKSGSIAEIGALGRLGQIFMILNATSSTLIVPYLAKLSNDAVKKQYIIIITGALLFAFAVSSIAILLPQPLLWIIGSKYAHLEREVGLLVLNSSIALINALMWDMNCSRKWIWSWIPAVSISSNIVMQVVLIINMDLSSTYNVLIFTIIISVINLLNKILVAFVGLNKNKDEINLLPAQ